MRSSNSKRFHQEQRREPAILLISVRGKIHTSVKCVPILSSYRVPFSPTSNKRKIIAPASTFKFIPKDQSLPFGMDLDPKIRIEDHGFPPGTYWVDHAEPGTVVVVEQPTGQYCAAVGGIMAARMKVLGVQGVVVDGRIRDLGEIRELELPVSFLFLTLILQSISQSNYGWKSKFKLGTNADAGTGLGPFNLNSWDRSRVQTSY